MKNTIANIPVNCNILLILYLLICAARNIETISPTIALAMYVYGRKSAPILFTNRTLDTIIKSTRFQKNLL